MSWHIDPGKPMHERNVDEAIELYRNRAGRKRQIAEATETPSIREAYKKAAASDDHTADLLEQQRKLIDGMGKSIKRAHHLLTLGHPAMCSMQAKSNAIAALEQHLQQKEIDV